MVKNLTERSSSDIGWLKKDDWIDNLGLFKVTCLFKVFIITYYLLLFFDVPLFINHHNLGCLFFPQQRKLMGSSAQISSGVCRCGSQEQVPEEGSRRFRRVPVCAGVGSGGKFRKVPAGSGVWCWRRFRRQVPEAGSGGFRRVWFVALEPWQDQPCDCFWTPFGDDIVRMGKTTAEQECAHVVKHGRRLLLLGVPPKLIFSGDLRKSKITLCIKGSDMFRVDKAQNHC